MKPTLAILCAGALAVAPAAGLAQTSSTSTAVRGTTSPSKAPDGSRVGGSGGTAAIGGNSATTLGVGGTSTYSGQTSSVLGAGGSAASVSGKSKTNAHVSGNAKNAHAKAQAMDKGTFAKSMTKCKNTTDCSTRTMTHQPGSRPTKETTTTSILTPP